MEEWEPQYWRNDLQLLHEQSQKYKTEFKRMTLELDCKLCGEVFDDKREFVKHVIDSEEHRSKSEQFLGNYIA